MERKVRRAHQRHNSSSQIFKYRTRELPRSLLKFGFLEIDKTLICLVKKTDKIFFLND